MTHPVTFDLLLLNDQILLDNHILSSLYFPSFDSISTYQIYHISSSFARIRRLVFPPLHGNQGGTCSVTCAALIPAPSE